MATCKLLICIISIVLINNLASAQVVINEGSNRNYSSISDEDGDYPDWVELYNQGYDTVSLLNYSISDKPGNPTKWVFPDVKMAPGQYKTIFCSDKDRNPVSGFINVINTGNYTPVTGWNTHEFTTPFYWDGISNILVNTCSYSSSGYTSNSVFNQSFTPFVSTVYAFQDGSPSACSQNYGSEVSLRPDMKFNGFTVGSAEVQNSPTDYPAPYGNWYWGAKNQMLVHASELTAAGLTAGFITSLSFSVVSTDPNTHYDYIDISMKLTSADAVTSHFETVDPNINLHTNFKISGSGETISLYSPQQIKISSLFVNCNGLDNSRGSFPDASADVFLFRWATPSATNNLSSTFSDYLLPPVFSAPPGIYDTAFKVSISNPNGGDSYIQYTIDGNDPPTFAPVYNGDSILVNSTTILKAFAIAPGILPSPITVASYLFGVDHTTPVLSVVTDNNNLYGASGIFDNWWFDWQKAAYIDYFDSTKQLIFSQNTGMQIDGGAGGSRAHPQHSFRLELDNGLLGAGSVNYKVIPNRPNRSTYSNFYLRNGSNQYLVLPYKDAAQVSAMGGGTNNYYSAWRPATVYINGAYFGLYELREKFDTEYFNTLEGADPDKVEILSKSYWYGGVLRPVEGSVESFWESYAAFDLLDPSNIGFWDEADNYFDLEWYTDYIIGESWIANTDWPYNNIKIYRSDKTGYRWRFCLIDLELSLAPNGWTDCYYDHIQYMLGADPANPYINIWLKGIMNDRFRHYFINRFADVMNTSYRNERILEIENNMYKQTLFEMPNEFARWGDPNAILQQLQGYLVNHLQFKTQLSIRTNEVRNHIQSNFALPGQVDVTLNVYPPGAGKIKISTITPDDYPWQGIYFNGIPVKIEALANTGFGFLHWGNNALISDTMNSVFFDILNTDITNFTAYFGDFTSAKPLDKVSGFVVYPNPAKEKLNILYTGKTNYMDLKYTIIDMNGRIIKDGLLPYNSKITVIDLPEMPASVYLLNIYNASGTIDQLRFITTN
jgi:hypothetical protein